MKMEVYLPSKEMLGGGFRGKRSVGNRIVGGRIKY
jgi:hypothetical protein